jgi:hypothetical protein
VAAADTFAKHIGQYQSHARMCSGLEDVSRELPWQQSRI